MNQITVEVIDGHIYFQSRDRQFGMNKRTTFVYLFPLRRSIWFYFYSWFVLDTAVQTDREEKHCDAD
jgi:hypothetical protein